MHHCRRGQATFFLSYKFSSDLIYIMPLCIIARHTEGNLGLLSNPLYLQVWIPQEWVMNSAMKNPGRHHCSVWIIALSQMNAKDQHLASLHKKVEWLKNVPVAQQSHHQKQLPNPQFSPCKFRATTRRRKPQQLPEGISLLLQLPEILISSQKLGMLHFRSTEWYPVLSKANLSENVACFVWTPVTEALGDP